MFQGIYMPHFRTLSEAIIFQVERVAPKISISPASPLAVLTGQNLPVFQADNSQAGVLRWGASTWGIEPVTNLYKPDQPTPPNG